MIMRLLLYSWLLLGSLLAQGQNTALTQKKLLFAESMIVMLPADYRQMTATQVAERYDATNPPNYVFRGPASTTNLAFSNSYQKVPTDEAGMQELVNTLKSSMEHSYPALFWVQHTTDKQNGQWIGRLEFKSLTPENEMVYNYMYLMGVNNQLVIANFNCECAANDPQAQIGRQILAGIKIE